MNKEGICLWCLWCLLAAGVMAVFIAPAYADDNHYEGRTEYHSPKAGGPLEVDGVADEAIWEQAPWRELRHRWLGPEYGAEDFQGRYKVVWTETGSISWPSL